MNVILGRQIDANCCLQLVWRNSRVPVTHLLSVVQSSPSGLEFNLISNKIFGPHTIPVCTSSTFHTFSKLAAYFGNSPARREALSEDFRNKPGEEIQVTHVNGQNAKKLTPEVKKTMLDLIKHPGLYSRSAPIGVLSSQHRKPFPFYDDKLDESYNVNENETSLQLSNSAGKLKHSFARSLVPQIEIAPDSTKRKKSRKEVMKQQPDIVKVKLIDIKYPFKNRSRDVPVKTLKFNECQLFLKSQGIPYDELESYPDIQMMSNNEILECVLKLKELHIQRIFSLFLIRRIHQEMSLGIPLSTEIKKFKNGIRRLSSLRTVQGYLELCETLNKPDLDIRGLMDKLAELGNSDDILIILKKVKKLQSVGATAEDILNNLELLLGYEFFYEKIELYEKTLLHTSVPRFPVKLFFAKNLNTFKEQLSLGDEIQEITSILDVSLTEFQACWGFRIKNTVELKYKIQMCLNAGISKQDIFNHLKMLDVFPVEKCHAATSCFRTSGLPASVYVLHHMENTLEMNGGTHTGGDKTNNEDWTCHTGSLPCSPTSPKKPKAPLGKTMLSTKRLRRQIFFMISNVLKLENTTVTTMYESGIDVSSTDVQDVAKNLDFLQSAGFSKEQIAVCPLILAHSNKLLMRVAREAKDMVLNSLQSTSLLPQASTVIDTHTGSLPNTASPSHEPVSLLLSDISIGNDLSSEDLSVMADLFASPERHLNTLQYLLEKENCFSLASPDGQKVSGFVDLTA